MCRQLLLLIVNWCTVCDVVVALKTEYDFKYDYEYNFI